MCVCWMLCTGMHVWMLCLYVCVYICLYLCVHAYVCMWVVIVSNKNISVCNCLQQTIKFDLIFSIRCHVHPTLSTQQLTMSLTFSPISVWSPAGSMSRSCCRAQEYIALSYRRWLKLLLKRMLLRMVAFWIQACWATYATEPCKRRKKQVWTNRTCCIVVSLKNLVPDSNCYLQSCKLWKWT